ncbi:hypothetical protein F4781DRAFT_245930 [Annulohypoxylon bovei var. microspora]|nr:hypothetical protein F4781DRAFT_245930 [Annulohypoxylon bovei var. microspora]
MASMAKPDESNRTRIRNNQRRSRARHKEYVIQLEKIVRHAELKRTEVNFEIQQAARKVSEENKKIRALLNWLGVSNENITSFLQTGNFSANEATYLNSPYDQERFSQTLDLLLQPSHLSMSDYIPLTSTSYPSSSSFAFSEPSSLRCDSIGGDFADSLGESQGLPQVHATEVDKHIQLHSPAVVKDVTRELETQGYLQYLVSSIPPSYSLDGPLQNPAGLTNPSGGSQLPSVQYTTDLKDGPTRDSFSSLLSIFKDSNYSLSPENTHQNSQCPNYTHPIYFFTG